jgi:MYXO-CTERM domain-containing protein
MRTHHLLLLLLGLGVSTPAAAITRDEVLVRARAYANHPWRCTVENLTASCDAGYASVYVPGDYQGLPYDWGGYMTLFEFDQQIAAGYGAGSYPADGVLECTAGVDCSGYVSQCWGISHHTTSNLEDVATVIDAAEVLPGDAFNTPGYHVILYSHALGNGDPILYESAGYNVHINVTGGWSYLSGYDPLRYDGITGTTTTDPEGTLDHPILIGSTPYTDTRSTAGAPSDVLDGCGAAPTTGETGPEVIYQIEITEPGQLTVSVTDDVGVDIDVHLYTSANTGDCIARNDATFTRSVDCGTYLIVADTFSSGSTTYPGQYQLTVSFAGSGQGCGAGPAGYDLEGEPGDPCAFPDHEDLPFCNPNLGVDTCIYTSAPPSSFCSRACTGAADCAILPGGCCADLGGGDRYCLTADLCETPPDPDAGVPDGQVPPADAGTGSDAQITGDGAIAGDGAVPGPDARPGDGGTVTPPDDSGGCQCRAAGEPGGPLVLALLVALVLGRRRRARPS